MALPLALTAQVDQSLSQPASGAQGTTQGSQPATSMRETLGAPGLSGQQLADRSFVRTAVEGGIAEIKLGELAAQKGGADLKPVAQKLADDHAAVNKDLSTVADALGVLLPKKMNKEDQAEFDKLSGLSGKDFDAEYVTYIFKAHIKDMHAFYSEAEVAADPDLATATANAMKTMHNHMGMLTKLAASDGITLPARPPRPPRP
jgi:putative membrane protein